MIRLTDSQIGLTNPVLAKDEIGLEISTNLTKTGNGVIPWLQLAYDDSNNPLFAAIQKSVIAEATTRSIADVVLQNEIDAEATARASADTTLSNAITAEATSRANADTALQNNITSEASTRSSADTALSDSIAANTTAISAEATNRANADSTLTTSVGLKADKSTTISPGTGLTGGGDLSANRTLAVSYGTSSSTSCVGNDSRLSDTRMPKLYWVDNTGYPLTGTTNETILVSKLIPGGTMSANDIQQYFNKILFTTVTANNKTVRIKLNTSAVLTGATMLAQATGGNTTDMTLEATLTMKGSLSSQTNFGFGKISNSGSFLLGGIYSASLNFANDVYLMITGQLGTTTTDTITLQTTALTILR